MADAKQRKSLTSSCKTNTTTETRQDRPSSWSTDSSTKVHSVAGFTVHQPLAKVQLLRNFNS
ncbi:unnamed protein product [Eruca vesicaria subsp. sativa]|uniref:Uncharacterized protein n=1 Tax=Eruca vesicaria subsp. sativa TaxID=29727 RepID=A0ABC8JM25_ERUVS|nr:unnamed protein product [Eruca vesicaria subsp. sativa]